MELRVRFDRLFAAPVGLMFGVAGEATLRFVTVLGIPHVDAPAVEADRVDSATRLDEEIHRVADLVLVAVRGLMR